MPLMRQVFPEDVATLSQLRLLSVQHSLVSSETGQTQAI
jgi:hypothetical protein